MNLNVRLIETFRAIMTVGTVTGAAEMLHTSQPAASRSLQRLEAVLGLQLFVRTKGRLVPTAHGLAFYDEVKKSYMGLDHLNSFAQKLRQLQQGHVSVVCAPVFASHFIADAAQRFNVAHPGVTLAIETQVSSTIAEWMTAQRVGLGIAGYSMSPPGTTSEPFTDQHEVCALPADHPLARKRLVSPADLKDSNWIVFAGHDPYRYRLDKVFEAAGIARQFIVETQNSATACALIVRGVGVAVVNPFTAAEFLDQGLVMRRFSSPLPFVTCLLRATHRPASPLVDAFAQALGQTRNAYAARIRKALT